MPVVRVFLCTYKRDHLLPRALDSLLAQTFQDWVCELHNDDPSNSFPRELAESIGDPRIVVVDHAKNLGPTATFNLIFQGAEEPFVTLLEDDTWWEPDFLRTMIDTIARYPEVEFAWGNMRVWRECEDGTWLDTGRDFWDRKPTAPPERYFFPDLGRIAQAIHSNGAMIVRTRRIRDFIIPNSTTFSAIEPVRERTFPGPILLVPQRVANFALTRSTSRSKDRSTWLHAQILLLASFIKHVPLDEPSLRFVWGRARNTPRWTNDLLLAGLFFREARYALRLARVGDYLRLAASTVRRPRMSWRTYRRVKRERELWSFLEARTAERFQEALQLGFEGLDPDTGQPRFRTALTRADRGQAVFMEASQD